MFQGLFYIPSGLLSSQSDFWLSRLLVIRPSDHLTIWSSRLLTIQTSGHQVFWPSSLLAILPSDHPVIQPSGHPAIWSSGHRAIPTSGYTNLKFLTSFLLHTIQKVLKPNAEIPNYHGKRLPNARTK